MQWMFEFWGQHLNLTTFIAYNIVKKKKTATEQIFFNGEGYC